MNGTRLSILPIVLALLAVAVSLAPAAAAQSGGAYTMTSHVIAGGGTTFSTGGAYSLGATVGQADASGPMNGGAYSLSGGFWPRVGDLLRGDATGDGSLSISDVFYLVNNLFAGGPPPPSVCVGDANDDGHVDIGDVFFLVNYLFAGGPAPSPSSC